jgi:hypothetical protein
MQPRTKAALIRHVSSQAAAGALPWMKVLLGVLPNNGCRLWVGEDQTQY